MGGNFSHFLFTESMNTSHGDGAQRYSINVNPRAEDVAMLR